jgi:XTP/dITP diphosphohydrolase
MKKLVFATNNKHKLEEIAQLLSNEINLLNLIDIGCFQEIEENADTLEGNASLKARFIHTNYGYDCFADDTGLEIEALHGRPGVYSARYAGEPPDFEANLLKVMNEMYGIMNRTARFRTIIALIINDKEYHFEGIINGKIAERRRGFEGFGYDPIFIPDGQELTFAEMPLIEKNKISHRAKAIEKLSFFLNQLERGSDLEYHL